MTVSTSCCSALDNIIGFIFKKSLRNGEDQVVEKLRDIVKMQNNVFQQVRLVHIQQQFHIRRLYGLLLTHAILWDCKKSIVHTAIVMYYPQIMSSIVHIVMYYPQIMSSIVHIVMYEECKNQWSMSRPLLGLILLNQEVNLLSLIKK